MDPTQILHQPAALFPVVEWEEPACLLCGGLRHSVLLMPDTNLSPCPRVVCCADCGLAFTSPRPTAATIAAFYPNDYSPHQAPHLPRPLGPLASRMLRWRAGLPAQRRLLDFGCGGGKYLVRMHRRGWEVTGLDISPAAVATVRRQGLRALIGSLPHPDLAPASFDRITLWQSLEHVHDPLAVLRAAHQLLAPGGRLLVAVPTMDSLAFRWFGPHWLGLDLPRHLTHFTTGTLSAMLLRAGFTVQRVRRERHSGWLRASAQLAGRRWLRRPFFSRLVAAYAHWTGQSDCLLIEAGR